MTAFSDHYSDFKLVEIEADVEVECSQCDLLTTIQNADLAGNRDELFLDWTCECGHWNYSQFNTADYIEER